MSRGLNVVIHGRRPVVRTGLRWMLENDRTLRVVGEADTPESAIELVHELRPDVVIIEALEGADAWLIRRLSDAVGTAVVVLSFSGTVHSMRHAFEAGARAFLLREASQHDVIKAVHVAASGGTYIDPELGSVIVESLISGRAAGISGGRLSRREEQVFELLVRGYKNSEMARELSISVRTVETHRLRINQKLGHPTRAEMVRLAERSGLLSVRQEQAV